MALTIEALMGSLAQVGDLAGQLDPRVGGILKQMLLGELGTMDQQLENYRNQLSVRGHSTGQIQELINNQRDRLVQSITRAGASMAMQLLQLADAKASRDQQMAFMREKWDWEKQQALKAQERPTVQPGMVGGPPRGLDDPNNPLPGTQPYLDKQKREEMALAQMQGRNPNDVFSIYPSTGGRGGRTQGGGGGGGRQEELNPWQEQSLMDQVMQRAAQTGSQFQGFARDPATGALVGTFSKPDPYGKVGDGKVAATQTFTDYFGIAPGLGPTQWNEWGTGGKEHQFSPTGEYQSVAWPSPTRSQSAGYGTFNPVAKAPQTTTFDQYMQNLFGVPTSNPWAPQPTAQPTTQPATQPQSQQPLDFNAFYATAPPGASYQDYLRNQQTVPQPSGSSAGSPGGFTPFQFTAPTDYFG